MPHYERVKHFMIDLTARKELGQGSQGTVYPGVNLITDDKVAAKRTEGIFKAYFNKKEFEQEADLLLNRIPPHKNIIKVHDFIKTEYESKGIPMLDVWLITELCELGNLKQFAFVKDLSIEKKLEIMYQSALAVRHLHGCKPESIAHRDVKPENILVTGCEDNPIIKLGDFGSAKCVTQKNGKSMAMVSLAGTRRYQAPEQVELQGEQFKYDKQVDIFSLGVTYLALLKAVKGSLMSPETINEKGLGEIMWMKHKQKQAFTFSVHEPSDSTLCRAIKYVIERMIKFEASSRLCAAQVVEELSKLRIEYSMPQSVPLTHIKLAPAIDNQSSHATDSQSAQATDSQHLPQTLSQPLSLTLSAPASDHQELAPATDSQSVPATDSQELAPATDSQSAPATDSQELAPATDSQELAPATDSQELAPATDCQSAPATDSQELTPATDSQLAPATYTQSAPATDVQSAPATDSQSAPATETAPIVKICVNTNVLILTNRPIVTPVTDTELATATETQPAPVTDTQFAPAASCLAPVNDEGSLFEFKAREEDSSFEKDDITMTGVAEAQGQNKGARGKVGMTPTSCVQKRRKEQVLTPVRWIPGTKVVALCDFKATSNDALSFKKHDVLTITNVTYSPNSQCHAKDGSGKSGMIPVEYVRKRREVQLLPMPWYHGEITREQAHALLIGENIPDNMPESQRRYLLSQKRVGTFLVRATDSEAAKWHTHKYTLSIVGPDKMVKHYRILKQGNKLTIGKSNSFENLHEIVLYHQKIAVGLCTRLQIPLVFEGDISVCVDPKDFISEGWSITQSEIHILYKCYAGKITETYKGEHLERHVFLGKRKEPCNVQDILIEAAIMSGLSHKNVVQLIGVLMGEETLIVTEYLDGGRLYEHLCSHGPDAITNYDQINFARDICHGMQYLEEKQIVHRKLLARSILLSKEGTTKIGDFSFAHPLELKKDLDKGVVKWAAPEALSKEGYTSKSDMWSFGVLLWEIYSFGSEPYPGIPKMDIHHHLIQGERLKAPDRCPDEVYRVMLATWDIDPAKRPTFSELCRALDRLCLWI